MGKLRLSGYKPVLKGFLLCAGQGTRFYPHTYTRPKSLLPFLNIPLVSYNLYLLKTLGVLDCAVNIHTHPGILREELKKQAEKIGLPSPRFSYEEQLLGSAGGLLKLKDFFAKEKHFFYLNGDSLIWPEVEDSLQNFYFSHLESGAMASFLVRPSSKIKGVLWADKTCQIHSFLKKPIGKSGLKAFDFSGLALFSNRILKEISPQARHIFKDVLESDVLKPHLRVYSVPHLNMLDMNQLSSYLEGTKKVLQMLCSRKKNILLQKTLDCFSPGWDFFQGEHYFSATKIKKSLAEAGNILFCGSQVKGMEDLSVKDFAVLGDHSSVIANVCVTRSVVGRGLSLSASVEDTLLL